MNQAVAGRLLCKAVLAANGSAICARYQAAQVAAREEVIEAAWGCTSNEIDASVSVVSEGKQLDRRCAKLATSKSVFATTVLCKEKQATSAQTSQTER